MQLMDTYQTQRLLKANQVCDLLQISKSKLYRLTRAGVFDVVRIGERGIRYDLDEIEVLMMIKETKEKRGSNG